MLFSNPSTSSAAISNRRRISPTEREPRELVRPLDGQLAATAQSTQPTGFGHLGGVGRVVHQAVVPVAQRRRSADPAIA